MGFVQMSFAVSQVAGIPIGLYLANQFNWHAPFSMIVGFSLITAIFTYFFFSYNNIRVGVFTDIGLPCENVINHFQQCHAAFLEANYDDEMLDKGNYPFHLKRRIRGEKGHLSNKQALELFKRHRPSFMTHLILAHLSQNNNSPELVEELFTKHAEGVKMIVASRHEETPVYCITSIDHSSIHHHSVQPAQMELFV